MAVVVAYDIYLECCDGLMRAGKWKQKKPVDFYRFREKLALQMLTYTPEDRKYLGDEKFRASTTQHKARRPVWSQHSSSRSTSSDSTLSHEEAIKKSTGKRLCGDLRPLIDHLSTVTTLPNRNAKVCVVCGKLCYHCCMKCVGPDGKVGVAMHASHSLSNKGDGDDASGPDVACFFHHHNTQYFGLTRNDYKIAGINKVDWKRPSPTQVQEHSRKVRRVLEQADNTIVNRVSVGNMPS